MEEILVFNATTDYIRDLVKDVGNQIGSVHFLKRKDSSLRKMSYRLHVKNPTHASTPKGIGGSSITNADTSYTDRNLGSIGLQAVKYGRSVVVQQGGSKGGSQGGSKVRSKQDRKQIDYANHQMTVLDVNKVVKDKNGEVIGRGQWRTIPLEKVKQITCNKRRYIIKSFDKVD